MSFHSVYLKAFGRNLLLAGFLRVIADVLAFIGPWCIEHVVNFAFSMTAENQTLSTTTQPPVTAAPFVYVNGYGNGSNISVTPNYVSYFYLDFILSRHTTLLFHG